MKKFMNALTSIVLTSLAFVTLFVSCNNDDDDNSSNGGNAITLTADQIVGKWVVTDSNSPYASFEFTADGNYIVTENTADSLQSSASTKSSLLKPESVKAADKLSAKDDSNSSPTYSGTYTIKGDAITLSDFGTIKVTGLTAEEMHFSFTLYATGEKYNLVAGKSLQSNVIVTTFAGGGNGGYFADGTRSVATFSYPSSMTIDKSDNLYLVDAQLIRKVTPEGVVSTIINMNPNLDALHYVNLYGIAIDGSGNLYVSDGNKGNILRVTQSGEMSIFVTGCSGNIAIDASGNLYVAGRSIQKVTPAGVVTTLVDGSAIPLSDFESLVGIVISGNDLYLTGRGNSATDNNGIYKVDIVTKAVTTIAVSSGHGFADGTGSNAQFHDLGGITIDASNNLYVIDGATIRKITSLGVVTTIAGSGYGYADGIGTVAKFNTFNGNGGITIDKSGNLYVADYENSLIRKISFIK